MFAVRRKEKFAEFAPLFVPYGNILQVRIGARQPSRGSLYLVVICMDALRCSMNERTKTVDIGGKQFLDPPVTENITDDRMLVRQFFQNIRARGILAALALFGRRDLQIVE